MNLKEEYNNLLKTEMYKEFMEHNPDYKLTHFFIVYENKQFVEKQIGFYSNKEDKVVSFDLIKHKSSEPEDAAKTSGSIPSFNINDISLDIVNAIKLADNMVKDNYSAHNINKYICVLQIIDNILIWNFTLITNTLNMINIRINAKTKEIISHNMNSIMSLAQS